MTLVFGNMTQAFVTFDSAKNDHYRVLQSNDTNVTGQPQAALHAAASAFIHRASLDASYLAYLGK
jgi:ATP-binding cassette subfamily B (MDR/TAP) protein 1